MLIEGNVVEIGRFLLYLCKEEFKLIIVGYKFCELEFGEFCVMIFFYVVFCYVKFIFNDGVLFIIDLDSKIGIWINSIKGGRYRLLFKRFV